MTITRQRTDFRMVSMYPTSHLLHDQVTKQVPDTYKEGEDALDAHGGDVYSFEEPLHRHHLPTVPHPSSPHVGRSPTLHPLTMAGRRSPSPSTQLLQPTLSPASPNTPVSSLIIEKQITPDVPLTSSEIESHVAEYISSGEGHGLSCNASSSALSFLG